MRNAYARDLLRFRSGRSHRAADVVEVLAGVELGGVGRNGACKVVDGFGIQGDEVASSNAAAVGDGPS